tara:strand:- start:446 stop:676 length:231 start_codon:yes stop_codon:yes gene_type:complete
MTKNLHPDFDMNNIKLTVGYKTVSIAQHSVDGDLYVQEVALIHDDPNREMEIEHFSCLDTLILALTNIKKRSERIE